MPAELPSFIELSPHLAVISPNLLELQSLLSIEPGLIPPEEEAVSAAERFHSALDTRECAIVVRAGRLGSYTLAKGWSGWVRPYFAPDEQDQVVDPTGGGNGFLGGLCAGLLLSNGDFRLGQLICLYCLRCKRLIAQPRCSQPQRRASLSSRKACLD